MPIVRVDPDVEDAVRQRRQPGESHNDTIRRLLGLPPFAGPDPGCVPGATDWRERNRLWPLLAAGLLHAGDTLTWHRPRRRETHTATVDTAGNLLTADGTAHLSPDLAATAISGYPCKGWPVWATSDGTTLEELRQRLDNRDQPADSIPPAGPFRSGPLPLAPLVRAGLLHEGQTLTWHRPLVGVTHTATLTAEGRLLLTDRAIYPSPNAAATAVCGHPCKGWRVWRTAEGTTLAALRQQLIDAALSAAREPTCRESRVTLRAE